MLEGVWLLPVHLPGVVVFAYRALLAVSVLLAVGANWSRANAESTTELQAAMSPLVKLDYTVESSKAFKASLKALMAAKNWDALEQIAAECRNSGTSWPRGSWKLDTFYEGVGTGPTTPCDKTNEGTIKVIGELHEWIRARPKSLTARPV